MLIAIIIAALATVGLCDSVAAGDFEDSAISFSGFGTLGLVRSSEQNADYITGVFKPDGPGHTREWSAEVDSRIGAQLSATLSPDLSAILQVLSEQRADDSYKPTIEWANVQYEITPDLRIRGGRIILPIYLASEYRKVGYANPWVRPPPEVYNLVPISSNDGVDGSYRFNIGRAINTIQLSYGRAHPLATDGSHNDVEDIWSLFDTIEYGPLTLHATFHHPKLTLHELQSFFEAFRQFGPQGDAIADRYTVKDTRIKYIGFGTSYDPGEWFVIGEYGRNRVSGGFIPDSTAWYVSSGYRFGDITPYLTYAHLRVDSETSDPGLSTTGLPPDEAAAAANLNAALNAILASAAAQQTISVGARWDFRTGFALKLQYDHVELDSGSPGMFENIQPGFKTGANVDLLSLSVDFVF